MQTHTYIHNVQHIYTYICMHIYLSQYKHMHVAVTVLFVRTVKPFPSISLFFNKPTPLTISEKQQQQQQRQQEQQEQQQQQLKGARVDKQTAATLRCRSRRQRLHQVQVERAVVIILI